MVNSVLKNAPETCDVKIICEGKEVIDQMIECTSTPYSDSSSRRVSHKEVESGGFVPVMRFMPNPIGYLEPDFNQEDE